MALKWIGGDFATGAASEQNVLPVTSGSDKVTVDVNAGDTASLSLSKRDLGSNWQDSIAEGVTLVALVDDAQAWNSPAAVLFAGWVDKATGKVGDAIQLEVAGLREYLAARIISPYANGGTTNQNEGIQFKADTWQGIMASIVSNAFAPVVGSPAQPPTILGNVDGVQSGTAKIRGVRLVDAEDYAKCLDNIRDVLSDVGNEYRLIPRWSDSTKTFIVWDVRIGDETNGKLNWAGTNTNIVLDASTYANLTFSLTRDSKGMANRVIGQSTTGTTGTTGGADYTVVTQANGKPLFDTAFNAGKLLTQAEMQAQLAARIADLKTPKGSATYEVSGNAADWLPLLGSKLSFAGGSDIDSTGYDTVVRLTNLDFSSSDSKIQVTVMLPQSRYPALPSLDKVDNLLGPGGSGDNSYGDNMPPSGGYRPPNYTPPSYSPWDGLAPPYIVPPPDTNPVSRIATGVYHTIAIANDGSLYAWGRNNFLQLTGQTLPNGATETDTPTKVNNDTDWVGVYASYIQSYALKKDNSLWAWGDNSNGELGLTVNSPGPAKVTDNVKAVYVKQLRNCHIIKNDGTLWGTGDNARGALGLGDTAHHLTFTQVGAKTDWVKIESNQAQGWNTTTTYFAGLDSAGQVWTWGQFENAQTGNITDGTLVPTALNTSVRFSDIMVTYNATVGTGYYAAGIGTDGKLYTWGDGYHDTSGTASYRATPALYNGPITIPKEFLYCHTDGSRPKGAIMVIQTDGTLWAFGPGDADSIFLKEATPYNYGDIIGGGDATKVFDWRKPYFVRTCATDLLVIVKGGEFWVGGWNHQGELGSGDYNPVATLLHRIGTDTNWMRLTVNQYLDYGFSLATEGNSMFATGQNAHGQLGMGNGGAENTTQINAWTKQPTSQ